MKRRDLQDFVQPVKARGRWYHYFRKGAVRVALPGRPGSREFQVAYDRALRQHAPEKVTKRGGGVGSLAWVIGQYKDALTTMARCHAFDTHDL
jgi:hypothetical protein